MTGQTPLLSPERDALEQYAEWYSAQGYEVSLHPAPRTLPEFLRALAPDLIAQRDGERIVVEVKSSSPASFQKVQQIARALEHRAGWTLRVIYADLIDPEWSPPRELPNAAELQARLDRMRTTPGDDDQSRLHFLLLWSVIEAAARHRLATVGLIPTERVSSSALTKMLLTEGVIEDEDYADLIRGLAVRNAIAHGFLNQAVDPALADRLRQVARNLLNPVEIEAA
jgi:hypothetical protein